MRLSPRDTGRPADRLWGVAVIAAVAVLPLVLPLLAAGLGHADAGLTAAPLDRLERGPLADVPGLPGAFAPTSTDVLAATDAVAAVAPSPGTRTPLGCETCRRL